MSEEVSVKPCPPYCDWPSVGHHIKEEMMRISNALLSMSVQFQTWMAANKGDTDTKIKTMMDDVARQLLVLSEACKANAEACKSNALDVAAIKAAMAKSVAIYGSIAGFLAAAIPFIVQLLRGKV